MTGNTVLEHLILV